MDIHLCFIRNNSLTDSPNFLKKVHALYYGPRAWFSNGLSPISEGHLLSVLISLFQLQKQNRILFRRKLLQFLVYQHAHIIIS